MDFSNIKAIYFDSDIIVKNDIPWGLLELGVNLDRPEFRVTLRGRDDEEIEKIERIIEPYNLVITQNMSGNVAEACHNKGIPYVSWIYDSPYEVLYYDCAKYDTNFIFAFDKTQVKRIRAIGVQNIFYQPLAANLAMTSGINITDEDLVNYASDISFVGKLYSEETTDQILDIAAQHIKDDYVSVLDSVLCKWGEDYSIFNRLSDETIEYIYNAVDKTKIYEHNLERRYLMEVLTLATGVAGKERKKFLNACADDFNVTLYTYNPEEARKYVKVNVKPPVEWHSEVYKVYYASKINLNLTLRSIETGIPQRIFDIMSVGGPVFSNYQEEMAELFVPDKEIVLFKSQDEFKEKAKYYLAHENDRIRLGINGYIRVRDEYNYPTALRKMLEKVNDYVQF